MTVLATQPVAHATAWLVAGFGSSTHDISAWGQCSGVKFCCVFDESSSIDTVTLDMLSFTYDYGGANESNLEPWDSDDIEGFILGQAGGDTIYGSNYAASDYSETLNGGGSSDTIYGWAGKDELRGNDGDDSLFGGAGYDTLKGGDGDDWLYGQDGDDKLCDSSGFDTCASNQGNMMDGGDGVDKLWYTCSASCTSQLLDLTNSSAGAGTDYCGNDDCWVWDTFTPANHEFPDYCEIPIDVETGLILLVALSACRDDTGQRHRRNEPTTPEPATTPPEPTTPPEGLAWVCWARLLTRTSSDRERTVTGLFFGSTRRAWRPVAGVVHVARSPHAILGHQRPVGGRGGHRGTETRRMAETALKTVK